MNKPLPHLITFPRSGSHFFAKLIKEKTMFNLQRSHTVNIAFDNNNNKTKTIVTIVRDPKDTITSLIALESGNGYDITNDRINDIITQYILFYSFLFQESDYVIDFKDLTTYPDTVVNKMLELLEIDKESYIKYPDDVCYDAQGLAKKSSKSIPIYNSINLDDFNISLCYLYYNKLLSKAIKFNTV